MISLRKILRGVATRFIPATAATALAVLLIFGGWGAMQRQPFGWLRMIGLLLAVAIGYTGALVAGRWRLRADSGVEGRRSAVAAPLALVLLAAAASVTQGVAAPWRVALAVLSGGLAAVATFWPWLRRPLDEATLATWEGVRLEGTDVTALGTGAAEELRAPTRAPSHSARRAE